MGMLFHSTRGQAPEVDIKTVALAGLAPDGGLYLPKAWPQFSPQDLEKMRGKTYLEVAFRVLRPFMEGAIPDDDLRQLISKSYTSFDIPHVVQQRVLEDGLHILELFHGPTLAFKDVALQFLGNVFEYFLKDTEEKITIIGATSGDTGSAAMAALANRRNIDVFILYPNEGPSEIQRKQMTCVDAPNVHAIAVTGTFDDCQAIVKAMFADKILRQAWNLSTVNSINLVRILAQVVYYFVAALSVAPETPAFVVPTGNFGDIYAAYAARQCGLPLTKLGVASNRNDILTRFFSSGEMRAAGVLQTLSPSMDIQVSSNFERLLFDLVEQNSEQLRRLMDDLKVKGRFEVSAAQFKRAQLTFLAARADDQETLQTIAETYESDGYVLDPHTAVGVKVAQKIKAQLQNPIICLATAHPAKFPETVSRAIGQEPTVPAHIAALIKKVERTTLLSADVNAITNFIKEKKQL